MYVHPMHLKEEQSRLKPTFKPETSASDWISCNSGVFLANAL